MHPTSGVARENVALAVLREATDNDLSRLAHSGGAQTSRPVAQALSRLAAHYLIQHSVRPAGDPVARFHLDNGARLERLNPMANPTAKGLRQSAGWMVNYLYDLNRLEATRERFLRGRVVHARAVAALL